MSRSGIENGKFGRRHGHPTNLDAIEFEIPVSFKDMSCRRIFEFTQVVPVQEASNIVLLIDTAKDNFRMICRW
jgi:hypothetical protein